MWSRAGCIVVLWMLASCKGEQPRPTQATSGSSSPSVGSVAPSASAARGSGTSFDEARAKNLVERWLKAQNEHDFAGYSALYAARFSGTKRVGNYSQRFDRAGWLRDRQPMFRDGVIVHASDLRFSGAAGAVRAVFTQDFVAPGFHDTGQKELFLAPSSGDFQIAREEMLVSHVAESAPVTDSAVLAFHRDGPVVDRTISSSIPGVPRLLPRGPSEPFEVALSIAPTALNEATRAWLGRSITAYGKDGATCQGTVTRFEVRVEAEPHFGMRRAWAGEDGAQKASPREIARAIWAIARDDERFVVAVLDRPCKGVWATTHPTTFTAATAPAAPLRSAVLSAFKTLPAYRELQARFVQESSNPKQAWENVDGELDVIELRPSSESALLVVSARGGAGCGGFGGNLSAIWKVTEANGRPIFTLRGVFKDATDMLKVRGAIDQNGDGSFELLGGPDVFANEVSVLRLGANGYERQSLFATSFWDCGC